MRLQLRDADEAPARLYEAGLGFDDLVRRPPLPTGKTPMDMRAER